MATVAQAIAQSLAGLYRETVQALPPGSMALAPPTPVESTAGEFQVVTAPSFPSRNSPSGVGPDAQHPTGILQYDRVQYSIGDPYLSPAFSITDRVARAMQAANGSLSAARVAVNAVRRHLYEQHMQDTADAAASFASAGTIDVDVQSTDLFGELQDAKRAICNSRGLSYSDTPVVLVVNRAAAHRMAQFDQIMDGPGLAGAPSGGSFRRLGVVDDEYFAQWLRQRLGIQLVVDDTLHLTASGTLEYTQTEAYLAVASGGESWSALKTLYVPMTLADDPAPATEADTVESEGLIRLSVTRSTGAQQAGWTIKADGQWRVTMFDASLGRRFVLANVPAA